MSVSRIRELADVMFSAVVSRLLIVYSRRFWIAPSLALSVETVSIASFTFFNVTLASSGVPTLRLVFAIPSLLVEKWI